MSFALADELRLLPHVVGYELRKATAFRAGFVLRELLRGVARPGIMILVYLAMFRGGGLEEIRGRTFLDLVQYLIWTAALQKCLTDERSLDLGEQIFDGYVSKYLVLPVSYFTLLWGKFLQFTGVQLATAILFWVVGAVAVPAWWPLPESAVAVLQAGALVVLGACCFLLAHFILCCLAFWLDVVWSLLAMFRFVSLFVSGMLIPAALMPLPVQRVFALLFPYWTVNAPVEILLGRQGSPEFLRGLVVLGLSLAILQVAAWAVWHRGLRRYSGVGA